MAARFRVYVQPRASRNEVAGLHAGAVKIRLAAAPVDNAANEALIEFVAGVLGVSRRSVRIVAGAASRRKLLEVEGVSEEQIAARLRPA